MNRSVEMRAREWSVAAALVLIAGPVGAQESGFVTLRGADTIAVERVERSADRLRGEVRIPQMGTRIGYDARLLPGALVERLSTYAATGARPDTQRMVMRFRADSAFVEAGGAERGVAAGAGALPYVNLAFGLLEQLTMRAVALGGESVTVPLFTGGQTFAAGVRRVGADSMTIVLPPNVEFRAHVDAEGRVLGAAVPSQGLRIERVSAAAAAAAAAPAPPPDYSAPAGAPYAATEVRVRAPGGHELVGTLTLPRAARGRVPAVVLISGSGPQDRDSAIPGITGYRPFREIADTLSRRGIAVLRFDERGVGASTGSFAGATSADFAADVRALVEHLRTRPEIDPARIGLVGHSEGGIVAPMVAGADRRIRAVALLAAPAWTGYRTSDYQLREAWTAAGMTEAQIDSMARLNAPVRERMAAEDPWTRHFLDYDPLPAARALRVPVLVLQGGTDRQVDPAQAVELAAGIRAAGNRRVKLRVLPGVNHLFLPDPVGRAEGYAALPSKTLPPEVRGALADWLAASLR